MFSFTNTNDFENRCNTMATIRASVISAIDQKLEIHQKKLSKTKILALSKLAGIVEKKIMLRKMDFWLPLRVHTANRKSTTKYEDVLQSIDLKETS